MLRPQTYTVSAKGRPKSFYYQISTNRKRCWRKRQYGNGIDLTFFRAREHEQTSVRDSSQGGFRPDERQNCSLLQSDGRAQTGCEVAQIQRRPGQWGRLPSDSWRGEQPNPHHQQRQQHSSRRLQLHGHQSPGNGQTDLHLSSQRFHTHHKAFRSIEAMDTVCL